jgi:hypothetical protein
LEKIDLTWIDVIDSAVKIGLGASIGAVASYFTLKKTQSFEADSRKESFFYRTQEERKKAYIDFSTQSHALIQEYRYASCDADNDDYKNYLSIFSNLQILCEDAVRAAVSEAFNAVTVYITFSKQSSSSDDDNYFKLYDDLLKSAKLKLAVFQKVAQMDATRLYDASGT